MPTSPAGRGRDRGFTLIELLVVVSIVSVLALGLGLRAGGGLGTARTGPERLADAVAQLRARAILGRQVLALMPLADGWQAMVRQDEGWRAEGTRVALRSAVFWQVGGSGWVPRGSEGTPPILFLPEGRHTAFEARFAGGEICQTSGWEAPSCR